MGKKPIVSVTYENERITIKNSLPYLKCVLRLSCAAHRPIYGRFMVLFVNGFLSNPLYGEKAVPLYWRSSILQGIYFLIRLGPWRPCRKDTRNKACIFRVSLFLESRSTKATSTTEGMSKVGLTWHPLTSFIVSSHKRQRQASLMDYFVVFVCFSAGR